jgi:hypothetical protein
MPSLAFDLLLAVGCVRALPLRVGYATRAALCGQS